VTDFKNKIERKEITVDRRLGPGHYNVGN